MRLRANVLRLRANGVRLRANGVRLRANGVRLRANGVRLRANRVRLRANGVRLRANRVRLSGRARLWALCAKQLSACLHPHAPAQAITRPPACMAPAHPGSSTCPGGELALVNVTAQLPDCEVWQELRLQLCRGQPNDNVQVCGREAQENGVPGVHEYSVAGASGAVGSPPERWAVSRMRPRGPTDAG